ncbi:MAG: hypothetical protein JO155_04330 [Acidimicrobiia bacterium]|nr:hypothetical protein [Acidimicrobiia bacterium]
MADGDFLPDQIVLDAAEARIVYLAVVAALDVLPAGEARDRCVAAQRVLVVKYLPDLPELGEE